MAIEAEASERSPRKDFAPTVLIFDTPEEVDRYVAGEVIAQVAAKPDSILTLPTGGTPEGMYTLLADAVRNDQLNLSRVTTFNLDEYWPIRRDNPASYNDYMRAHLFGVAPHMPLEERRFIPDGEAPDPNEEARRYEALLEEYGPADLAILGIGPGTTAHVGFNEQGSKVTSRTRYMPLDEQTRRANAVFFDSPEEVPTGSLTQGIADILDAGRIILIAKGEGKAWGVQRSLQGEISSDAPASFLRLHPNVTFVLDRAAAKLLKE